MGRKISAYDRTNFHSEVEAHLYDTGNVKVALPANYYVSLTVGHINKAGTTDIKFHEL